MKNNNLRVRHIDHTAVLFSGIAAAQVVGSTTSTIDSRSQIKHLHKMDPRSPNVQIFKKSDWQIYKKFLTSFKIFGMTN